MYTVCLLAFVTRSRRHNVKRIDFRFRLWSRLRAVVLRLLIKNLSVSSIRHLKVNNVEVTRTAVYFTS